MSNGFALIQDTILRNAGVHRGQAFCLVTERCGEHARIHNQIAMVSFPSLTTSDRA